MMFRGLGCEPSDHSKREDKADLLGLAWGIKVGFWRILVIPA